MTYWKWYDIELDTSTIDWPQI